jgi:hypothetical protein
MGFNTMLYDGLGKKSLATEMNLVAFSQDFTSHDPAEVSKVTFNFTKMSHVGNKWQCRPDFLSIFFTAQSARFFLKVTYPEP